MSGRRVYDAGLPMYAAWSLESPIFTAVVFLQLAGNEVRVIDSRNWKLKPLHSCIADVVEQQLSRHWRIRAHITPSDRDLVYQDQFADAALVCEAAPDIRDTVILTRRLFSVLSIDPDHEDLIEAINTYAPRPDADNYIITPGHTLARFYVRCLEIFAAWRHAGNGRPGELWSPAPNYAEADRAIV